MRILFHFRQSINDSCFIDWTGEGPIAKKIVSQTKIDDSTYAFILNEIYDQNRLLIIHLIDREMGIAVFEQASNGCKKRYYIMIMADKLRSVPIIVNHCPKQKQAELQFDLFDYQIQLKMKEK